MKAEITAAIATISLAGCADTNLYQRMQEGYGEVRIDPRPGPNFDFTVNIQNRVDIGYDPDDKANRDKTALQFARNQCSNAQIVGETSVTTGTYLTGRPAKTYSIQIRCPKG